MEHDPLLHSRVLSLQDVYNANAKAEAVHTDPERLLSYQEGYLAALVQIRLDEQNQN